MDSLNIPKDWFNITECFIKHSPESIDVCKVLNSKLEFKNANQKPQYDQVNKCRKAFNYSYLDSDYCMDTLYHNFTRKLKLDHDWLANCFEKYQIPY